MEAGAALETPSRCRSQEEQPCLIVPSPFPWVAHKQRGTIAVTRMDGQRSLTLMHRLAIDCPSGFEVDHRNRNTLDNRRSNLRIATRAQNMRNRSSKKPYGYKGVRKAGDKFSAHITVGGFDTPEEAYTQYCLMAELFHGEFAFTG